MFTINDTKGINLIAINQNIPKKIIYIQYEVLVKNAHDEFVRPEEEPNEKVLQMADGVAYDSYVSKSEEERMTAIQSFLTGIYQ